MICERMGLHARSGISLKWSLLRVSKKILRSGTCCHTIHNYKLGAVQRQKPVKQVSWWSRSLKEMNVLLKKTDKTQTWMWQFKKKMHITAQNHTNLTHRRVSSLWLNCLNLFCKTPICSNETENIKQGNLGLKFILVHAKSKKLLIISDL